MPKSSQTPEWKVDPDGSRIAKNFVCNRESEYEWLYEGSLRALSPPLAAQLTSGQYSQTAGTQRKTSPATATWQTDGNDR